MKISGRITLVLGLMVLIIGFAIRRHSVTLGDASAIIFLMTMVGRILRDNTVEQSIPVTPSAIEVIKRECDNRASYERGYFNGMTDRLRALQLDARTMTGDAFKFAVLALNGSGIGACGVPGVTPGRPEQWSDTNSPEVMLDIHGAAWPDFFKDVRIDPAANRKELLDTKWQAVTSTLGAAIAPAGAKVGDACTILDGRLAIIKSIP